MRTVVVFLACLFSGQICYGWSEGGHHLIVEMAFDDLTKEQQGDVIAILKSHPRFAEDFAVPANAEDPNHWLIGRAAYWPDVARSQPLYHRPNWHWQPGATLLRDDVEAPAEPGSLPPDATLETQDLYLSQAIELCRSILRDQSQRAADRAIALCWVAHLVNNARQPCHVGSLYCKQFPEGDDHGRSIRTLQGSHLYSLWDGALGRSYDAVEIQRQKERILHGLSLRDSRHKGVSPAMLDPITWVALSRKVGATQVYSPELIKVIEAGNPDQQRLRIDLSQAYLENAERTARSEAKSAARLFAEILRQDLAK